MSRFAPEYRAEDFDFEVANLSNGKTRDLLKRDGITAEDFLWGWRFNSVFARPAVGFRVGVQRQVKIGILANASDECRTGRKRFEQNLVGVAAINGNEKVAPPGVRSLVESIADADDGRQSDLCKGESFFAFFVVVPFLGRGILFGFSNGRSWFETDRQ